MKMFNIEEFEFSQSYLFFWDKVRAVFCRTTKVTWRWLAHISHTFQGSRSISRRPFLFSADWALLLLPPLVRGNSSEEGAGRRTPGAVPPLQSLQWWRTVGYAGESHWFVRLSWQVVQGLNPPGGVFIVHDFGVGWMWNALCFVFCTPEKYGVIPKKCFPESHSSEASRRMNHILNHKVCSCDLPTVHEVTSRWRSLISSLLLLSAQRILPHAEEHGGQRSY